MSKGDKFIMQLLAALIILMIILIGARNCVAQTPPMRPVNPDWTVNPLGVLIDIDDIYRELQAANANTDTNALELDTALAEVDTNAAQIDTLHARVDSLMTRDTVFCGYNTSDIEVEGANNTRFVVFDATTRNDAIYTLQAGDSIIDVSTAGDYLISYSVTVVYSSGSGDGTFSAYMSHYYSGGWNLVAGSSAVGTIWDASGAQYASVAKSFIITMAAGDDLKLAVFKGTGMTVNIEDNTTSLVIQKLH